MHATYPHHQSCRRIDTRSKIISGASCWFITARTSSASDAHALHAYRRYASSRPFAPTGTRPYLSHILDDEHASWQVLSEPQPIALAAVVGHVQLGVALLLELQGGKITGVGGGGRGEER